VSIGSAPEVGVTFARWGEMDEASRQAWFDRVRGWVESGNLMIGYANLCFPPGREP
jgi:hypothetical protein